MYPYIYLASKSPRRQELLTQIGVPFKLLEQHSNEQVLKNEKAKDFVSRLAYDKATSSYKLLKQQNMLNAPVLGSDTIVVKAKDRHEDIILGKPKDKADALKMLYLLSDSKHSVYTAVCLTDGIKTYSTLCCSDVYFHKLSDKDIENYWNTGEPKGKAGSYAIQGKAAKFIKKISGSYSGIMGLPLFETSQLLEKFNCTYE